MTCKNVVDDWRLVIDIRTYDHNNNNCSNNYDYDNNHDNNHYYIHFYSENNDLIYMIRKWNDKSYYHESENENKEMSTTKIWEII